MAESYRRRTKIRRTADTPSGFIRGQGTKGEALEGAPRLDGFAVILTDAPGKVVQDFLDAGNPLRAIPLGQKQKRLVTQSGIMKRPTQGHPRVDELSSTDRA